MYASCTIDFSDQLSRAPLQIELNDIISIQTPNTLGTSTYMHDALNI